MSLRVASSVVSTLESRIKIPGFNIDNWKAQLAGNQGLNFAVEIRARLGKDKIKTTLDAAYILAGNKGASGALWGAYAGNVDDTTKYKIDDYDTECLRCIGFLFAQLMNGKPFAVVNSGRGLIIEKLLESLNPDELYVTILKIPVDDKGNVADYLYDITDIRNYSHAYAHRSRLIMSLDSHGGRDYKPLVNRKATKKETW